MQTVAPLITALIALSLATSMIIRAPRSGLHRSYTLFAGMISVFFLCLFFQSKGGIGWQYAALFSSLTIAPACLELHARVLPAESWRFRRVLPLFVLLALVQSVAVAVGFQQLPTMLILTNGSVVFAGLVANLVLLWQAAESVQNAKDRDRLLNGLVIGVGTVALMGLEMAWWSYGKLGAHVLVPPPFGTLTAAVYVYFLGEVIVMVRLLDRHEIITRAAVAVVVAAVLALIYRALGRWIAPEAGPAAEFLNIFLASLLILNLYEPVQGAVERGMARLGFAKRSRLTESLNRFRIRMAKIIATPALVEQLLLALDESGRADTSAVYLWSAERDAYQLYRSRGRHDVEPLAALPRGPFSEKLRIHGELLALDALRHLARTSHAGEAAAAREMAATMTQMNAELVLPFRMGERLLGWLVVADSAQPLGYTVEERRLLTNVANRAAVVLENAANFERMRERDRLAALGEMSAGLAHEIRNPLGALKGAAQYLDEGADVGEDDREMIAIILEETDRLNTVVSQFLEYARPIEIRRRPADLEGLVRQCLRLLEAQGVPESVRVSLAVPDDPLPPAEVDEAQLRQVLLNLLLNALQALGDEGRIDLRLRHVDAREAITPLARATGRILQGQLVFGPGGALELAIEDNGRGINPDDLGRLFIPFFTTRSSGTGLGLPICQRIIGQHGGELEVTSRPGEGSCFTIRLPCAATPPLV